MTCSLRRLLFFVVIAISFFVSPLFIFAKSINDFPVSDDLSLILKTSESLPVETRDNTLEELLTAYVKSAPADPLGHYYLSNSYFKEYAYDEALRESGEALAIEPEFSDAHAMSSSILYQMWDVTSGRTATGTLALALKASQKSGELSPRRADFHIRTGGIYEDMGMTGEAVAEYSAAISLAPALVEERLRLAMLLMKQNKYFSARRQIVLSLILCNDKNRFAPGPRDDFYMSAEPSLNETDHEIKRSNAVVDKGRAFFAAGKVKAAEEAFKEALADAADNSGAMVELGNLYAGATETAEIAERYFEDAVAADPFSLNARRALCDSLSNGGVTGDENSVDKVKLSLCLDNLSALGGFVELYNNLWYGDDNAEKLSVIGAGALKMGLRDEAVDYLTAASVLDPNNAGISAKLKAAMSGGAPSRPDGE